MKINNIFKLAVAVAVSLSAGAIGSVFTTPAISGWYAELAKPALNPPNWIFGLVWTLLYVLMGIALFLIWKQRSNILENARMLRIWKMGIAAFFVQLILNAAWSVVFFGFRSPGWALVNIVLLWLAIVWTMVVFYKISPPSSGIWTTDGRGRLAAYLLVPYILWVSFATYLNYSIWIFN